MGLGSLENLSNDIIFDVMSVPATITRPEPQTDPIAVSIVWMTPTTEDTIGAFATQRREKRRVFAVRTAQISSIPRGSIVVAADEFGGNAKRWRCDGPDRSEADLNRYIVIPDTDVNSAEAEL